MLFHINQIFKWGMGHVRTPCMHVRHTHTIPKERSYQKKKKVGHVIIKYLLLLFRAPFCHLTILTLKNQ